MDRNDIGLFLRKAWHVIAQVQRGKASDMLEFELKELENIFGLLLLGGFLGFPAPPAPIALELLPYMERELSIMMSRSDLSLDPLGSLMGMLQVD